MSRTPPQLKDYAEREMALAHGVKVRQDFEVAGRGFSMEREPKRVPIVINNFNRLSCLKQQVDRLRDLGYENLYVIDNASTYEPLLDYYRSEKLRVFYLSENVGYLALWKTSVRKEFMSNYYIYTDSDIVPVEDCPDDFAARFKATLDEHRTLAKAGFGLKIDDLPESYANRDAVAQHERQFWTQPITRGLWHAPIDTTLALYRPGESGGWWLDAARTDAPYLARHVAWYADSANPSEEERFYLQTAQQLTHWTGVEARRGA